MKKQKLKNLPVPPKPTLGATQLMKITDLILEKYNLDKIICFGSQINTLQKESCFDDTPNSSSPQMNSYYLLLIPSKDEKCPDIQIQQRLEEQLKSLASVTILIHKMKEFNKALQNGSSFFRSVYKNGIVLHDNNEEQFVSPGDGEAIDKRITRREKYWDRWHKLSVDFVTGGQFFVEKENSGLAVFMLHQALQHCYSGMIRVLTGYKTNSNSLRRLLQLVDLALPDSSIFTPFRTTPEDLRLKGVLLKGFSDARYDDTFTVTKEDLLTLYNRIMSIINDGNKVCVQRIADLKSGKAKYVPK